MVDQTISERRTGQARSTPAELAIRVEPAPGGWRLQAPACGEALMFLSGGCAERQARLLALRLAELGYDTRVDILDRDSAPAGSIRYAARQAAWDHVSAQPEAA